MAKRAAKETNVPLVVALVFFVLTTVAFGVMWYMQYSDQQAKDEAVKNSKKDVVAANTVAKEWELTAKMYRVLLGVPKDDDATSLAAEHKANDKPAAELDHVNKELAKKFPAGKVPAELQAWAVEGGKIGDAPAKGIVDAVTTAAADVEAARKQRDEDRALLAAETTKTRKQKELLDAATAEFTKVAEALPTDFKTKLDDAIARFEKRKQQYSDDQLAFRRELDEKGVQNEALEREKKVLARDLEAAQEQRAALARKQAQQQETFPYDEPQGTVTGPKGADGTVTISLGSNDLVRPGLTFTILPYDFPEKGRQSRVRRSRVPDERGNYQNVDRFEPKGTLEVIQVLGPNSSRARVTGEYDPIGDGIIKGDLVYNSVWRKGTADHVALIGIFDVNADGRDDIEAVIKDLAKMGVPVDAYYDLKGRKWVGQITEQTRFVVRGRYPKPDVGDANLAEKGELLKAMSAALKPAEDRAVTQVDYRDFFPRMGYKVKVDLPTDKLNAATAPYLNRAGELPPGPGN